MDSGDEALPPEDAPTTPTKPEKKSARFADLSGKKQKQNEETHEVRKSASVDATEQQHLDSCKHRRSGCNECTYIKHGHKWGKVLPCLMPDMGVSTDTLPPEVAVVVRGTWLVRQPGKEFKIGCIVCKMDFEYKCLGLRNLQKHHQSDKHERCVLELCGQQKGPTGQSMTGAPSSDEFMKVWDGNAPPAPIWSYLWDSMGPRFLDRRTHELGPSPMEWVWICMGLGSAKSHASA
jgi:hypothetical protein